MFWFMFSVFVVCSVFHFQHFRQVHLPLYSHFYTPWNKSVKWWLERGHSTGLGSLCAHPQIEGKRISLSWRPSQMSLAWGGLTTWPMLMVVV